MNYFYGVLLILLGVLVLVRYVFKVKIPIYTASIAIIVILAGVSLFIHGPKPGSETDIVFSSRTIQVANPVKDYGLTFSGGTIDLSTVSPQYKGQKITINSVLSSGTIKINPETPAIVRISSSFALSQTPDNSNVYFGTYNYKTKTFKEDSNYFDIEVKNIFANLIVEDVIIKKKP